MIRRHVLSLLTACALLGAGLFTVPGAAAAEPGSSSPAFGSSAHFMWTDYSDEQRVAVLDRLKEHGVTWVRIDVSWAMLQPDGPDDFSSWGVEFVDRVVEMTTARGIKPLIMLWMTPAWANGGAGERTLPTNVADYARVARWAASRWAGKVAAWEVWNEPNLEHFMTGTDPAAYARLLRAAYPAFHAGDPTTKVVFGGTVYNDADWIAEAYDAGAGGHFDIMATHPYQAIANLPPEEYDGTLWTLKHAHAVHDLMVRNGDGDKPIWFTEFGWSDHQNRPDEPNWSRGVTQAQQAEYLVRTIDLVEREMPFVTNMFWYNERNRVDDGVHNNNYGLMTHDLQPKPVMRALRDRLASRTPAQPVPVTTPTGPPLLDCAADQPLVAGPVVLCASVVFDR